MREFKLDFEITALMIILKKSVKYIKKKNFKMFLNAKTKFQQNEKSKLLNEIKKKKIVNKIPVTNYFHVSRKKYENINKDSKFLIHTHFIEICLAIFKGIYKRHNFVVEDINYQTIETLDKKLKELLLIFSKLEPNYDEMNDIQKVKTIFLLKEI